MLWAIILEGSIPLLFYYHYRQYHFRVELAPFIDLSLLRPRPTREQGF